MNPPIIYTPKFVDGPNEVFKKLWNELDWKRHFKVPRREYYCNTVNAPYSYGVKDYARVYKPQEWHPEIIKIKEQIEQEIAWLDGNHSEYKFEVCFLNGYENQSDHLGWHSDDSPEMDDDKPIAIVSLGVEREIWFGLKDDLKNKDRSKITKLKLENGSLCLMLPYMQETWMHRIPKASFQCGERVSLTFRGYKNEN